MKFGLIALFLFHAVASTEIANQSELVKRLGLESYSTPKSLSKIKIAILDNGFQGFSPEMLPSMAKVVVDYTSFGERYSAGNTPLPTRHGLTMAQIIWAVTGQKELAPELHLLNANGFTNFKNAVQYVLDQKINIVLYSQNWEYGGNFDGEGIINSEVSKLTKKGILWINAAGNYGGMVQNHRVKSVNRIGFTNRFDENQLTFTISWNDFFNDEYTPPTKDLDVRIIDEHGKTVASGSRAQIPFENDTRERSNYSREKFNVQLDRGHYTLEVFQMGGKFDVNDRFRLTVQTEKPRDGFQFDHPMRGQEIMIPADHKDVLAIGDGSNESSQGPTMDGRSKPDLVIENSNVSLTNGLITRGSSNAAALYTGALALMQGTRLDAHRPLLPIDELRNQIDINPFCSIQADKYDFPPSVIYAVMNSGSLKKESLIFAKNPGGRLQIVIPKPVKELDLFSTLSPYLPEESLSFFLRSRGSTVEPFVRYRTDGAYLPSEWIEIRSETLTPLCKGKVWKAPHRLDLLK